MRSDPVVNEIPAINETEIVTEAKSSQAPDANLQDPVIPLPTSSLQPMQQSLKGSPENLTHDIPEPNVFVQSLSQVVQLFLSCILNLILSYLIPYYRFNSLSQHVAIIYHP